MQEVTRNEAKVHRKKSMQSKDLRVKSADTKLGDLAMSRLEARGVDTTLMMDSLNKAGEADEKGRKRVREENAFDSDSEDEEEEREFDKTPKSRGKFKSRRTNDTVSANGKRIRAPGPSARARQVAVETSVGAHQKTQIKKDKKTLTRHLTSYAKRGEADREHYPKLVKHLNSGKSSLGTSTIGR